MNKKEVMSMLDNKLDNSSLNILQDQEEIGKSLSMSIDTQTDLLDRSNNNIDSNCWGYWRDYYYPEVIRESYPVYIKERSEDKGKKAFEVIKSMMDKRLLKMDTVRDFIEAMDLLIKIL